MSNQFSGQLTLSGSGELAVESDGFPSKNVEVRNTGANAIYLGDSDSVDSTSGYTLPSGASAIVRLKYKGGTRDLYVNGTSGDTFEFIATS
jgi:hypothetical protein